MTQTGRHTDEAVRLGPLSHDIFFMGRNLQAFLRPQTERVRDALNLEHGVIGVLSLVWINPGISQMDIAMTVALKKSAVTMLVTKLENQGLLLRKQSQTDRRAKALYLTAQGECLVEAIRAKSEELQSEILSEIPEPDKAAFFRVLGQLMLRRSEALGLQSDPD